jgi:hypothetical protein
MSDDGLAAVAYVCQSVNDLRAFLPDPTPLDDLVNFLRSETKDPQKLSELVEGLHVAVMQAGDVRGVHGDNARSVSGAVPLGFGSSRPASVVFICPRGHCDRTWTPERGDATRPICEVFGEELAWKRR